MGLFGSYDRHGPQDGRAELNARLGKHPISPLKGNEHMIERIDSGERSSKIVKHNGVAYKAKLARPELKVEFIVDAAYA